MSAASQNPNKALSSAAAAAALRARPHTPTNVAEVQTKRIARRSASVSSSGSAAAARRRPNGHAQLQRRDSSASMTERTFRSPSPHQSSTPASSEPQPPVPQIAASHKNSATGSRRAGAGMQTFRTASQKVGSATHSWYGQPAGDTSNVRRSDTVTRTAISPLNASQSTVASQPPRPDSRGSVNFSYPTAFRAQSPPASPTSPSSRGQTGQQLVYDPNSRRMVPKRHVEEAVDYRTKQAADKPSRRKKEIGLQREGSQLAKGTVNRTKGTIMEESRSHHEPSKPDRPEQPVIQAETYRELPPPQVPNINPTETEQLHKDEVLQPSESTRPTHRSPPPSTYNAHLEQIPKSQINHMPSNGLASSQDKPKENYEVHENRNRAQESRAILDALDDVPTRQTLAGGTQPAMPNHKRESLAKSQQPNQRPAVHKPPIPEVSDEQKTLLVENKPVIELAGENGGVRRSSSNSPARQARFAPSLAEKLAVRHAPLPRSASPIKSAMKHSNAVPRENSPSDNASDPCGSGTVSPNQKDDSAITRRKSVRVSFDDKGAVVVGESSSVVEADPPATPSPQAAKRAWYSNIGRNKKKEIILDDDEIMAPRPALPSFGSIRDKKIREPEERPLVRPLDVTDSPAASSPELRPQSSSTLNDSEILEELSIGQSSDHALGSLLVQDYNSRITANTSRFREPLPPEVTSVEGSGYHSDSVESTDTEERPDSIGASIQSIVPDTQGTDLTQPDDGRITQGSPNTAQTTQSKQESSQRTATPDRDIPQIAVLQPSPMIQEEGAQATSSSTRNQFNVPGRFPDCESGAAIFEPTGAVIKPDQAASLPQTTLDTVTPVAEPDVTSEDESEESIYSDAYEDIPDVDSSGFMSLDAIVENPTHQTANSSLSRASETLPNPARSDEIQHSLPSETGQAGQAQPPPPRDIDDWEQAKAFWRSLTAERRRQLELEAGEEAGAEGDRDEAAQLIRRNNSGRHRPERILSAPEAPVPRATRTQSVKAHHQDREYTAQAESKGRQGSSSTNLQESHMRKTLREGPAPKAVSSQPQSGMRKTMRTNGEAQSVKVQRQKSGSTPPVSSLNRSAKPRAQSSTTPAVGSQYTTQTRPALQRRGSDASDSSFKRNRPTPSGTFAFRKTMRQPSSLQPQTELPKDSGRFSLRSLSPAGSSLRRYSNSSSVTGTPNSMMNRTLRSSNRSSNGQNRSSIHFPLFGRSSKSSVQSSKRRSRLDDSSDEDEAPPVHFQSRIEDSSEEEDVRPSSSRGSGSLSKGTLRGLATAPSISRPTPVPEVEEDSSELPDSDDDFMPSPLHTPQNFAINGNLADRAGLGRTNSGAIGTSTLGRSGHGQGGLTPSFTAPSLRTKEKRSSLMSILRRNKAADQSGKIHRSELIDSAARRDTKLERDPRQLRDLRGELSPSPRLQKRNSTSQSDVGGIRRPTSVGNMFSRSATTSALERPHLAGRRSVSLGQGGGIGDHDLENASVEGSGVLKKKKFAALRRMFKLDE